MWAENFLVSWKAAVTAPVAGSYKFFASSDDGIRIWVKKGAAAEVQVLNRWGAGADVQGTYASAVTATAGEVLSLRVEYMEATASAFANVWIEGPYGPSGATKLAPLDPTWLGTDSPLPVGWTLSAGVAYWEKEGGVTSPNFFSKAPARGGCWARAPPAGSRCPGRCST